MQNYVKTVYAFDACPDWLRTRGDYVPWLERGRLKAAERLDGWQRAYSPSVFDSPQRAAESRVATAAKLFACWVFHWECAGIERDGDEVARSLEEGKGFARGGNLGGNPLYDLVMAEALTRMQTAATELYEERFRGFLHGVAKVYNARLAVDRDEVPEWWNDFLAYLAYPRELQSGKIAEPKLRTFAGKSGFKQWLRMTFTSFLPTWCQKNLLRGEDCAERNDGDDERGSDAFEPSAPPQFDDAKWSALRKRVKKAARQAVAALSADEKTVVRLFYVDKVSNNQIACLFGESATRASRRRVGALEKFASAFNALIANDPELRDEFGDDGARLDGKVVADVFFEVFADKAASEKGAGKWVD